VQNLEFKTQDCQRGKRTHASLCIGTQIFTHIHIQAFKRLTSGNACHRDSVAAALSLTGYNFHR
jgi:hypothetical protein